MISSFVIPFRYSTDCRDKRPDCDKLIDRDWASIDCEIYKGQCDRTCEVCRSGKLSIAASSNLLIKDLRVFAFLLSFFPSSSSSLFFFFFLVCAFLLFCFVFQSEGFNYFNVATRESYFPSLLVYNNFSKLK